MKMSNRVATIFVALSLVALAGCSTFTGSKDNNKRETAGEYVDDAAITTKVKAAIFNDPATSALQVKVETFKGVVQLSGFVDSQASIDRAVQIARSVEGVKSVKNNMSLKR